MAIPSPDPVYLFRGDMGCIHCILLQSNFDVEHLFVGTTTGKVHIWDLKTNRELCQIESGQDSCLSLQSLNDKDLFVQHKCGVIKAYKKTESQWSLYKSINIDFYHYCRFQAFSQNEIFVPLKESNIGILSSNTFNIELKLNPSNFENLGDVMVIKPLKNKRLVLAGYEGGKVILWDIRQRSILSYLTTDSCPMTLDFDTASMKGIVGSPTDQLQIFVLSESYLLCNKVKVTLKNSGTSVIAIRPDAKIVAVGGWDSRVRLYSWKSLKPLAVLDQHRDTVQDIAFSLMRVNTCNDKYLMATAAKDGYIALWDIYN
ncbi:guanine nucleotide-binding protein subunit beta-like protein 1 [Colletes latitarsis]|uniref:guanine nucleotide-binding protein subunit beta-like protein 1 n=1 Tax=Colletes latitarsis TaxID=2605962 RepID=UPI004035D7BE